MSCGEQRLSNAIMYKETPPDAVLHPEVFCFIRGTAPVTVSGQ
jgi:hypothetical protein